jgi:cytochrome c biogenesis protein CcmG/thiol:disulfide interchange protein DsbE
VRVPAPRVTVALAPRVAVALALLVVAAGCSADDKSSDTPSPFAGCAALTTQAAPQTQSTLPDLKLPCFTGSDQVSLRALRGPAVINLWASWCGPCRLELPVMQKLADTAGDKITVMGVDTGDTREAGASFAADQGVGFPTLFDQDKKLINALARINLPITIFVDAAGKSYVNVLPLDAAGLTKLVREHAGVTVAP